MDFVDALDTSIFSILTAASQGDRRSFLAIQRLIRTSVPRYVYLEVGSESGGSLVPHVLDGRCRQIVSIDLRPATMPDERAQYFGYPADAEQAMMRSLGAIATAAQLEKIKIFRKDVSDVGAEDIEAKAHLALIDAEHTNTACFSDAVAVLGLVEANSIIMFHDANLISDAIQNVERMLKHLGVVSTTVFLPDCVAAIGLGSMAAAVSDAFADNAFDRATYLQRVRKERWEMVAASVNQGLHQT